MLIMIALSFARYLMQLKISIVLNMSKRSKLLLDRKLQPVSIRLLMNMYTSQVTRVGMEWRLLQLLQRSERSKTGRVISLGLLCAYVDGFKNCCQMLKLVVI